MVAVARGFAAQNMSPPPPTSPTTPTYAHIIQHTHSTESSNTERKSVEGEKLLQARRRRAFSSGNRLELSSEVKRSEALTEGSDGSSLRLCACSALLP